MDVFTVYSALYFSEIVGLNPSQVGIVLSALMVANLLSDLAIIPLLERVKGTALIRFSTFAALFIYSLWLLVPRTWSKVILALFVRFSTIGWDPVVQGEAYTALPNHSGSDGD